MSLVKKIIEATIRIEQKVFGFTFKRAKNKEEKRAVYKVRYEVYKNEGYIEPNEKGIFKDKYDLYSVNFIAEKRGEPVGTARLVFDSDLGFPTENLFNFKTPKIPRERTVEISRLAIKKEFRGGRNLVILGLMKEIHDFCKGKGVKYLYANMPERLADYFRKYGVSFQRIEEAPPTEKNLEARKLIGGYFSQKKLNPYLLKIEDSLDYI